jgi:hypothetical protein
MRLVSGAYRATPIRELETETHIPPVDIYCKELRARRIRKIYSSPVGTYIQEQCRMISSRLQRRNPQRTTTPAIVPVIQAKLDWASAREVSLRAQGKRAIAQEWGARWRLGNKRGWFSLAASKEPSGERLKLHSRLKKAESAVLVQARTGRIGLASFLNKIRVPGVDSPIGHVGKIDDFAIKPIEQRSFLLTGFSRHTSSRLSSSGTTMSTTAEAGRNHVDGTRT